MADLYVLEGRGNRGHGRHAPTNHPIRPRRYLTRNTRVPGIVHGDPLQILLGRSIWGKIKSAAGSVAKVAVSPVTATYSVTKSAVKATGNAIAHPSFKNISKIVTNPATRAVNVTKDTVKEAGHAALETGRAANTAASRALDITRRVAKRLIKKVAKKVLFHGDTLLGGSVAAIPKNAAKGVLIPVATAAVLANTITAPAAPVVPVLVNEVIDELYNSISDAVAKGLSPSDAAKKAQTDLDKLEPGEENDPKVGFGSFVPIAIGVAAVIGAIVLLRRRS